MPRDPLQTVLRLRIQARDAALRDFAAAIERETEAARRLAALEQTIGRETEAASSLDGDDTAVEAFGAWFRRARAEQDAAAAAQEAAAGEMEQTRAILAIARAAVRAVEELLAQAAGERRAQALAAEQKQLDEIAGRPQPE